MNMSLSSTTRTVIAGLCLFAFSGIDAHAAAIADSLSQKLKAISAEMSDRGKNEFILVEALSDGLLKDNSTYVFQYTSSQVIINGKELPEPLMSKYISLMKNFFAAINKEKAAKINTCISMTGNIHMKDVLNPNSTFRKSDFNPRAVHDQSALETATAPTASRNYDAIIRQMAVEGLADTTKKLEVVFNSKGVSVNDQPLPAEAKEKYFALFVKEAGFTPTKGKEGVVITR